jgi:hypothetical protein
LGGSTEAGEVTGIKAITLEATAAEEDITSISLSFTFLFPVFFPFILVLQPLCFLFYFLLCKMYFFFKIKLELKKTNNENKFELRTTGILAIGKG